MVWYGMVWYRIARTSEAADLSLISYFLFKDVKQQKGSTPKTIFLPGQGIIANIAADIKIGLFIADDMLIKATMPGKIGIALLPAPACERRLIGANNRR